MKEEDHIEYDVELPNFSKNIYSNPKCQNTFFNKKLVNKVVHEQKIIIFQWSNFGYLQFNFIEIQFIFRILTLKAYNRWYMDMED